MAPDRADPAHESTEWVRRGQRALRAGRRTEARRAFQAALAADSLNAGAWLCLARLSAPRARLAYTARALELGAPQAQAELRRARRLRPEARAAAGAIAAARPARALPWTGLALAAALLAALTLGLYAARARPAQGWGDRLTGALQAVAAEAGNSAGQDAASARLRPMATLTATPTQTPTQTATRTRTPAPTATPSATPSPPPSDTPTASPPTPTAPGERWIEVDLSDQRVVAREGDTVVNSFLASTGTWRTPTVMGEFRVYVKYAAADMAGPGYYLSAVPYVMYFHQGYGLHGTYWHNNFGMPMSHGCVNLRTEDAGWLFEWASVGTRVVVHD
jgi:lipoprotein-anchoring transpeptidase ErfK/SrfK